MWAGVSPIPNRANGRYWSISRRSSRCKRATGADQPAAPSQSAANYQVIVSAKTNLGVELLLPDRLGSRFLTGNRMPIFAFVPPRRRWVDYVHRTGHRLPDNSITRCASFLTDGQHDDGDANDGFYGGVYTGKSRPKPLRLRARMVIENKYQPNQQVQNVLL